MIILLWLVLEVLAVIILGGLIAESILRDWYK